MLQQTIAWSSEWTISRQAGLSSRPTGVAQVGRCASREQLGSGHHGIVNTVGFWFELSSAAQVVNKDIGIDEEVSHGPIRPGSGPQSRVLLRMWQPGWR